MHGKTPSGRLFDSSGSAGSEVISWTINWLAIEGDTCPLVYRFREEKPSTRCEKMQGHYGQSERIPSRAASAADQHISINPGKAERLSWQVQVGGLSAKSYSRERWPRKLPQVPPDEVTRHAKRRRAEGVAHPSADDEAVFLAIRSAQDSRQSEKGSP